MDPKSRKRALLLAKYWDWEWHFRRNGTMWIRDRRNDEIINVGRID